MKNMRKIIIWTLFSVFFIQVFLPIISRAENEEALLNQLFAPGPLIEGHKDLEGSDCLKCHEAGRGISSAKCLDCHKEIKSFVQQKKGFHGLTDKKCIDCHKDHQGRQYDSTLLIESKFNHHSTGYSLLGKHSQIKCIECHKEKRQNKRIRPHDIRYLGQNHEQTTRCDSCHQKDSIHGFTGDWLKKDCHTCHNSETWKKVTEFDHNRNTSFRLEGKHAQIHCNECHLPNEKKKDIHLDIVPKGHPGIYHWTSFTHKKCLTCHNDYHGKNLNPKYSHGKCDQCHSQQNWSISKFDHQTVGFSLRGQHAKIRCIECHKAQASFGQGLNYKGLTKNCSSCHKDPHYFGKFHSEKVQNPSQCQLCHSDSSERKWKSIHSFNHSIDTNFVIDGKHSQLQCNDCHHPTEMRKSILLNSLKNSQPGIFKWRDLKVKTCNTCHDNPHKKSFSDKFLQKKCTDCHTTEGWDKRSGSLKKHFDHNTTRFALTGSHKKLDCLACHNVNGKTIYNFQNSEKQFCISCHSNPHQEQFHSTFSTASCVECHNTERFSERKPFDHSRTSFFLSGQHRKVTCLECHSSGIQGHYNNKPVVWHQYTFPLLKEKQCTTCHEDFHKGQLGNSCQKCHSEETWKPSRFNHNKDSSYHLVAEHLKVRCDQCHQNQKDKFIIFGPKSKKFEVVHYKPMLSECVSCHKKEDAHKGQFGVRCQDCHTERGWKQVKNFHQNFTLNGSHFTLSCTECHQQDRRLGGSSNKCNMCHQKDDVHGGSLPLCAECHRQSFWEHTTFQHSMSQFPLRGVHRTLDCMQCHQNGRYQGTNSSCRSCHTQDVNNHSFNHSSIINSLDCSECHSQFSFERK